VDIKLQGKRTQSFATSIMPNAVLSCTYSKVPSWRGSSAELAEKLIGVGET
jgi:hypothetical protein